MRLLASLSADSAWHTVQKPGFAVRVELPDSIEIAEWIGVSLAMALRPSDGEKAGGGVSRPLARDYARCISESILETVPATFSCAGSRRHPPSASKRLFRSLIVDSMGKSATLAG